MPTKPQTPTYIGIAFYTAEGFAIQSAVVLSTSARFNTNVSCGTVIETVNGWVVSWKECNNFLATTIEPYLALVGITAVAKVHQTTNCILQSISSLVWNAQDARDCRDSLKHPYSSDYVRRVLLHLSNKEIISLPFYVTKYLDEHITDCLIKLRKHRDESEFSFCPVIPFMEVGEFAFGRPKF